MKCRLVREGAGETKQPTSYRERCLLGSERRRRLERCCVATLDRCVTSKVQAPVGEAAAHSEACSRPSMAAVLGGYSAVVVVGEKRLLSRLIGELATARASGSNDRYIR